MALTPRLQLRQSQALVMTPQLMQAIKLLQLSSLDLVAYVEAELERNPLLERADDGEQERPAAEAEPAPETGSEANTEGWEGDDGFGRMEEIDRDSGADNVFSDGDASPAERPAAPETPGYSEWAGVKAGREDADYNLEAFVESQATLADHLSEQLALAVADPQQRMIGGYLIDLVDDTGYITGD